MGFYLNTIKGTGLPSRGKAEAILALVAGSKKISPPLIWEPDLVCVVNNGTFEAAAHAYSEEEMHHFLDHLNGRPAQWMLVPNAHEYAR